TLAVKDKVKGKQTKVLFRKVASGEVPEITAQKKKLGFPVPIRVWLRMPEYYEKVRKAFSSPAACRYFRIAELERLLTEHLHGEKDNSRKIWTVYMFLVWYQVYFGQEK
ncbi:MAG: asparagine synthase-related protein, partial [Oliverpabstia sp.]